MRVVFSALYWSYIAVSCAVLFGGAVVVWLVTLPFDPRRRVLHLYSCGWAYHYILVSPLWSITFEGRHHIPDGAAVLVSNHQSLADIVVLFGLFRHFKWVSKRSIFKVPFIGWNMRLNRYVPLERGSAESIEDMMQRCLQHLREGSAVMIFPEGTRSHDGELRSFKHGAFTLAVRADVPVVPIALDGTGEVLPRSGWVLRGGRVRGHVRVLPPIEPIEAGNDALVLQALAQTRIQEALTALQAEARSAASS